MGMRSRTFPYPLFLMLTSCFYSVRAGTNIYDGFCCFEDVCYIDSRPGLERKQVGLFEALDELQYSDYDLFGGADEFEWHESLIFTDQQRFERLLISRDDAPSENRPTIMLVP